LIALLVLSCADVGAPVLSSACAEPSPR
jgi:hypothetical protein